MAKRKRKKSQPSHRFLSVTVKLTDKPVTMNMSPPIPEERKLCKDRLERLGHLRMIHGFLSEAGFDGDEYCMHNCCDNPDCPIITVDFKTTIDWGEARIIGKTYEEWVISIFDTSREQAKKCPSLRLRRILTPEETEMLVGMIIQATMPLFVDPEVAARHKARGKQNNTCSYLDTGEGETRWINVASFNAFLNLQ